MYFDFCFVSTIAKRLARNNIFKTRMWANAQRDGRPAEYRWRPVFNAAKYGWRPLLECRAVTLPRCETRWNVLGCPRLPDRSQPLVGRSSPYCGDIQRTSVTRITYLHVPQSLDYIFPRFRENPGMCFLSYPARNEQTALKTVRSKIARDNKRLSSRRKTRATLFRTVHMSQTVVCSPVGSLA